MLPVGSTIEWLGVAGICNYWRLTEVSDYGAVKKKDRRDDNVTNGNRWSRDAVEKRTKRHLSGRHME